jgi:hypothetical protein
MRTMTTEERVFQGPTYDFILYWNPTDVRPTAFGLYIWRLPFDGTEQNILQRAVSEIVGVPEDVVSISFTAGNGHGTVRVTYDTLWLWLHEGERE